MAKNELHKFAGAVIEIVNEDKAKDAVFLDFTTNCKYVICAFPAKRASYGWKVKLIPAEELLPLFDDYSSFHHNTGKRVTLFDVKTETIETGVFLDSAKKGKVLLIAMKQTWTSEKHQSMFQVRAIRSEYIRLIGDRVSLKGD
jgi:hypothetical protein